METLETISRHLEATKDLQSLVRSMKTLALVSVRQLEKAEESLVLFRRGIEMGLQVVLRDHTVHEGSVNHLSENKALILFGSDRGLCGSFNENAAELAFTHLRASKTRDKEIVVLAVGAQAAMRLEARGRQPNEVISLPGSVQGLAETCATILIRIDRLQQSHRVHQVECIFNHREENGEIMPRAEIFLPVPVDRLKAIVKQPWPSKRLPTYTADTKVLFSWLIRQHLFTKLYSAGLSSMAGENAARLASMQHAERNITEQLDTMTADYRRLRQDAITTELMDIVGGYEALKGAGGTS